MKHDTSKKGKAWWPRDAIKQWQRMKIEKVSRPAIARVAVKKLQSIKIPKAQRPPKEILLNIAYLYWRKMLSICSNLSNVFILCRESLYTSTTFNSLLFHFELAHN